jgi:hypothetical protein
MLYASILALIGFMLGSVPGAEISEPRRLTVGERTQQGYDREETSDET